MHSAPVVLWPSHTGWLSTQLSIANTKNSPRPAWPCPRVGLFSLVCSSEEMNWEPVWLSADPLALREEMGGPTGNLCGLVQIHWPSESAWKFVNILQYDSLDTV